MRFELSRLSVLPRAQMDGFERRKADGTPFTREEWIRAVFSEPIEFTHRKEKFHYVPQSLDESGFVSGRIGRRVMVLENEPPDQGLNAVQREAWRAAWVVIDPTHHPDGQKAGIERLAQIGRPIALLESLISEINGRIEPFLVEANAIVSSSTFWQFVRENKGDITSVEFEFVAPNMFGGSENYDKEMKELQAHEKVQKAKLRLESKDGLNLDTPKVKSAAEYALRGTGSITAHTRTKKRYSSKDRAQTVTVPGEGLKGKQEGGLLTGRAGAILGR